MYTSLRKLRGLAAINRHNPNEKKGYKPPSPALLDELAQASQDILDMKNCYDSLLSAAAATANSAYEFSEAMREMGTCLLEKTALNDDEESGRVLLMIGKAQFELQKLVDSYRVHVIQTITTPSESLLKELQTVEEMSRQCDDKRNYYKFMLEEYKENGKSRNNKDISISSQQLREAQEDYEQEAALFVFRIKSLKQGQCRSLLTQAARHHAAQLNFFRRGVKSLEIVEPRVEVIAQQQHIDYQFSGLEDDDTEDGDDIASSADGELNFDYKRSDLAQDVDSMSRSSIELDQIDIENDAVPTINTVKEILDRNRADMLSFNRGIVYGSQSAPILAEKQLVLSERVKQMRPSSTRKFCTYVLPTPVDAKLLAPTGLANPSALQIENTGELLPSPLKPNKFVKDLSDKLSSPTRLPKAQSVLKESNINSGPIKLPLPLAEELILSQSNPIDARKIKRQAFSGPLTNKAWSSNSKVSPSASPPPMPSAKISELHKLPRPPTHSEKTRPSGLIGHSAPLVSRVQQLYTTGNPSTTISQKAAPLPTPPEAITRSFSIPSSGRRRSMSIVTEFLEVPRYQNVTDALCSPQLKPMIITSNEPTISESVAPATKPERMW